MSRSITAVRGAVDIPVSESEDAVTVDSVGRLIRALQEANGFGPENIISILFTQTPDLTRINAAAALRRAAPEYAGIPLFCSAEPLVDGAPERMIRILVTWEGPGPGEPVYLGAAARLRPDLFGDE